MLPDVCGYRQELEPDLSLVAAVAHKLAEHLSLRFTPMLLLQAVRSTLGVCHVRRGRFWSLYSSLPASPYIWESRLAKQTPAHSS